AATKCPGYEAPAPDPLPSNQVILEDGETVAVGDVDGTAEVADGELVGVNLPANAVAVVSGTEVDVGGVPATLTVTGGVLSPNATLDATNAVVKDTDAITIKNSAGATISAAGVATVAANAVSGVALPATIAGVANSASVTLLPASGTTPAQGTGTAAVAAGVVTGVRLPATSAVVTDGQTIAVTGGTVTLTVAGNAVTAEFPPAEEEALTWPRPVASTAVKRIAAGAALSAALGSGMLIGHLQEEEALGDGRGRLVYIDPVGVRTWCYGDTGPVPNIPLNAEVCASQLDKRVREI